MASEHNNIAELHVDRDVLFSMAFSMARLKQTSDAENGAIGRFLRWIQEEDKQSFDVANARLGNAANGDDYYLSYYKNGMMYRIMRDGRVRMESADPLDMMGRQYDEFNKLVETILTDELAERINAVLRQNPKVTVGDAKPYDVDANGMYSMAVMRLFG